MDVSREDRMRVKDSVALIIANVHLREQKIGSM